MEFITIESKAFQELMSKINQIAEFVEGQKKGSIISSDEIWMDTYDVCKLFHVSTKTLQRLRTEKYLPFTKLRGKCLYRLGDIEKALSKRLIKGSSENLVEFKRDYLLRTGKLTDID